MSVDRFDLVWGRDGPDAKMIRRWPSDTGRPGEWIRWEAHVEATCKMRDKLLELAKECSECGGTGVVTISGHNPEAVDDCPACEDIRECLEP